MLKNQIAPAVAQEMFDSCANAADKGQAQYLTPLPWARALARALPKYRPVLVDLACGTGTLLAGARTAGHSRSLGVEIQRAADILSADQAGPRGSTFITADLTRLAGLLEAVSFRADCFVLNPPWDLHWYRDRMQLLARSSLPTVRAAFAAYDGRTPRACIDSTIVTLALALHFGSEFGEGYLIANEDTLQRLLLGPNAPHRALAAHVWAHVVIEGNICTSVLPSVPAADQISPAGGTRGSTFKTGVIYFARGHTTGPSSSCSFSISSSIPDAEAVCDELQQNRLLARTGLEATRYSHTDADVTWAQWSAAGEEWLRTTRTDRPEWNLFLAGDGTIRTQLSLFDQATGRVDKAEAEKLHELNGKHPMQLVIQKAHRLALQRAAFGSTYRVEPALQVAVQRALADYERARTPLYPLSPIQRLAYLDEKDDILCVKDLAGTFCAGQRYSVDSRTMTVLRHGTKLNAAGLLDDVRWDGQELALYIGGHLFMDGRWRDPACEVLAEAPGQRKLLDAIGTPDNPVCAIEFTQQQLVDHFEIPEVPDVAIVHRAQYERGLQLLAEIERLVA